MSTIKVEFIADAEHLRRVMANDIPRDAQTMADKVEAAGRRMSRAGDVMSVGVTAPLVLIGKSAAETALQFEQMSQKAETVFGSSVNTVRSWADANAAAMGLASDQAVGLAANFADLLVPMGFARDEAAQMSTDVIGLSGALSEWSGGTRSASEVAQILSSAMLGERDALKGLGIAISEADVTARLAAKGQQELTGAALEQAEALATSELIFEKSTDAQAAFAAGGNETVRAMNEAKAAMSEASAEIGRELLPILADVAGVVADVVGAFSELPDGVQTAVVGLGAFAAAAGPVLSVGGRLVSNFKSMATFMTGPWGLAVAAGAVVVGGLAAAHIEAQRRIQEYTAAIEADSGALGENTEATIDNAIAKAEIYDDLITLGLSVEQLKGHLLGEAEATAAVQEALDAAAFGTLDLTQEQLQLGEAASQLTRFLNANVESLDESQRHYLENALAASQASQAAVDYRAALDEGTVAGRQYAGQLLEGRTAAEAVGQETTETTEDTRQFRDAMAEAAEKAGTLNSRLQELTGVHVSADQAAIRYQQTLASVAEELSEGERSLDLHTEAGRENLGAILELITESGNLTEALQAEGAGAIETQAALEGHVEDLTAVMQQAGFTEEQIHALIEEYNLTPDDITTAVHATGIQSTVEDLHRVRQAMGEIGTTLQDVAASINISVANINPFADGGIEDHVAQIAPAGAMRLWAEPETGGEAYIPLSPAKRGRSTEILGKVADRFGMTLLPFEDGGLTTGARISTAVEGFKTTDMPAGIAQALAWALGQVGKPYIWGAVGPNGYDCSGYWSAITNVLFGRNPHSRLFATASFAGGNGVAGYVPGAFGPVQIGVRPTSGGRIGHMSGSINGVNLEATPPRVRAGAGARGPDNSLYSHRFSLRLADGSVLDFADDPPFDLLDPQGQMFDPVLRQALALANGGIVNGPTRALIGESGPEAVIPLDRPLPVNVQNFSEADPFFSPPLGHYGRPGVGAGPSVAMSRQLGGLLGGDEDAMRAAQRESERLNSELGRALGERTRLYNQLAQLEVQRDADIARILDAAERQTAQLRASRLAELTAFNYDPTRTSTSSVDDRFILYPDLLDPDSAHAAFGQGFATQSSVGQSVLDQLTGANADLEEFNRLIAEAREAGLDEDTIALLGINGPDQLDLLRDLTGDSLHLIDDLVAATAERYRLGADQVNVEASNMVGTLGLALSELQAQTDLAMQAVQDAFATAAAGIAAQVAAMTTSINLLLAAVAQANAQAAAVAPVTSRPTLNYGTGQQSFHDDRVIVMDGETVGRLISRRQGLDSLSRWGYTAVGGN